MFGERTLSKLEPLLRGNRMAKIDFGMIVFNAQPFLELNLKNIYSFANRIIIIEGPVNIYQKMGYSTSDDGTIEIIKNFPDPEKKIFFESGFWKEKDEMVRAQEKYFNGDWIFAIDADEFYHHEDLNKLFCWLNLHDECYSVSFRLLSFFGGFDRTIGGFEADFEVHRLHRLSPNAKYLSHRPPTLLWTPTGKTCREMGHFDGTKELGIKIHHYSHLPPKRMKHKADYYQQYSRSIISNYFESLYVPWLKAKTDAERLSIENIYRGVQEFRPECRTDAYTLPFFGNHPNIIEENKKIIQEQIEREIKELNL